MKKLISNGILQFQFKHPPSYEQSLPLLGLISQAAEKVHILNCQLYLEGNFQMKSIENLLVHLYEFSDNLLDICFTFPQYSQIQESNYYIAFNHKYMEFQAQEQKITFEKQVTLDKDLSQFEYQCQYGCFERKVKEGFEDYNPKQFKFACLGGTFDHIHFGHKVLLSLTALSSSQKILIGLSTDQLLEKKQNKHFLQPYDIRQQKLCEFLENFKPVQWEIVPLTDPVGPAGVIPDIDILILTEENYTWGPFINERRARMSLQQMKLYVVGIVRNLNSLVQEKMGSSFTRQLIEEKSGNKGLFIKQQWDQLCQNLNIKQELVEKWWSIISDHYSEAWRYYHIFLHVLEILNQEYDQEKLNSSIIKLSAFFHDVIYFPWKQDNEEMSIELLKEFHSETQFDNNILESTISIIQATKKHEIILNIEEEKVFLDFDMWILSSPWKRYSQYMDQIRQEYVIYDDETFKTERKKVLEGFLQKERIYFIYQDWEVAARENLAKEIESLSQKN